MDGGFRDPLLSCLVTAMGRYRPKKDRTPTSGSSTSSIEPCQALSAALGSSVRNPDACGPFETCRMAVVSYDEAGQVTRTSGGCGEPSPLIPASFTPVGDAA